MRVDGGPDRVADADETRLDDFGQDALVVVFHLLAEARADGIHFGAGRAGFIETENGAADSDTLIEQSEKVNAESLDIGADCAGRDGLEAEGGGVFDDLFARDEGDLAAIGLSVGPGRPAEITGIADDAFAGEKFN